MMTLPAATVAMATTRSTAGNLRLVVQLSGLVAEDGGWTPMSEQPEQASARSALVLTVPTRRSGPPSPSPLGVLAGTFMWIDK